MALSRAPRFPAHPARSRAHKHGKAAHDGGNNGVSQSASNGRHNYRIRFSIASERQGVDGRSRPTRNVREITVELTLTAAAAAGLPLIVLGPTDTLTWGRTLAGRKWGRPRPASPARSCLDIPECVNSTSNFN